MNSPTDSRRRLPPALLRACARRGVVPTRFVVSVNLCRQTAALFEKHAPPTNPAAPYRLVKIFRCSTSKFGVGETAGSNRTPRGLHRIAEKIGGGWPVGAAFVGRKPVGFTWRGKPAATITSRILWLEGLEPGLNRHGDVDSRARYIYIHGTANEPALGRPDSHGCIHLAANDLIPLYDKIPGGSIVWMSER
jgi:lipoprotein-anchoring transpeptidase ErfK/SrfK